MVIINFLSKVLAKTRIWQLILSVVIFSAIIVSCSTSLPSTSVTSSSTSSVSDSSTQTINKKLIAIELEKSPSRLSFTPNESISALGGSLRLYYDDYSSKLISTSDQMIDESKLNTSSVGVSTITLKYAESDNEYSVSYQVQILPYLVPLSGINLDIKDLVVYQGQSFKINLSVSPLNAYYNRVVWNSTNPLVASIDQTGLVTTINPGKTIISVDVDGKYVAFTTLEVIAEVIDVTTPVESNSLPSVQSFVDLGYIPITSLTDLNQIRLDSAGTTTFGLGTPYEVEVNFIGNDSSDANNALNKDYVLVNHVDLISVSNWTPIGDDSDRFKGIFEGNNKQIQNLTINSPTGSFLGLFGGVGENAEINNLIITVKSISGLNNIGALAGIVSPTVIVNNVDVLLAASLPSNTIAINGSGNIGGLVGNHALNSSGLGSTPFVFTLGEDGKYHYSNELGRILPHTLSSDDFAVIDQKLLTQQADGKYYLSITQEYNEISYADEVNLHIIEHPENHEVVLSSRREDEDSLSTLIKLIPNQYQPINQAIDSKGVDVTSTLLARDELWTPYESFENGYYEFFELSLGNFVDADHVQLVYSSVRDYTKDFENMFVLQVLTNDGNWVDASVYDDNLRNSNVRRPISYPRLTLLDLTKTYNLIGRPSDFKIKFGFNRVSYDYFAVSTSAVSTDFTMIKYSPEAVELKYRGFSNYHEDLAYKVFDYHDVSNSPHGFYQNQSGYFTKYGDVTPLLSAKDNQFAIIRYGDELKFSFKAPFKNTNNLRSYVLGGSIWFKHVTRPQGKTVEPIPYQGMSVYPHTQNSVIDQEYIKEWNTRYYPPLISNTNTITQSTTNVIVRGIENVGGLVGYNDNGNVINSAAYGNVIAVEKSNADHKNNNIGGLIGLLVNDSEVTASIAFGDVLANFHSRVGGLIGTAFDSSIINNTINIDNLIGSSRVGGLIGFSERSVVINNSVETKKIEADGLSTGGLVGRANRVFMNSNYVNIKANTKIDGNGYVGGVVGNLVNSEFFDNTVTIAGEIFGQNETGGLIGYAEESYIYNSTITTSETNLLNGGLNGSMIGGAVGYLSASRLENIEIFNKINIIGRSLIGGLVGNSNSSQIGTSNENAITIDVSINGLDYVGGLVGGLDFGRDTFNIFTNNHDQNLIRQISIENEISNYQVLGSISASEITGGLIGEAYLLFDLKIKNSSTNVDITGANNGDIFGGLIGRLVLRDNSVFPSIEISNSNSTSDLIVPGNGLATGSFIGRLVLLDFVGYTLEFKQSKYIVVNSSGSGSVNGVFDGPQIGQTTENF